MILTIMHEINPIRGEIWQIRFDPSEGDEIGKVRPAVVMNVQSAGRMRLRIVVPLTGWQPQFERYFWMTLIQPSSQSGLSKESSADAFQLKSLSINRFVRKIGVLSDAQLQAITAAIILCVGHV